MLNPVPEIVAAVDLGSNSFHMIVCSLHKEKLQTIDSIKEMVRLAAGLDENNCLDEPTVQRALACLERFGQRIRHFPAHSVRVVGTNTLRMAQNSQSFIVRAEQALGHSIHIISGIEEARLIYQGVANSLSSPAKTRLVMDIGGGSTEYIIGTDNIPQSKESLHMGCVTLSTRFFKNGVLSKKAFKQALLFAEQRLEPHQSHFKRGLWDEAIGASGSLRAIDKVLQASGWSNNGITLEGLEKLVEHINNCSHIDEIDLPELNEERLPVFVGGVVISYASFKSLNIQQMTVSDGALREGLVHDLLGRIYNRDIRSETVNTLVTRYHTDRIHAQCIQHTIEQMLKQMNFGCNPQDQETIQLFLNWAVQLHEIGCDIAHSHYHKHGAYMIENADLSGFSQRDQTLLATLVLLHRKRFLLLPFKRLPEPWNRYAPIMTVILRLAVLLHRSRQTTPMPEFDFNWNKPRIQLTFPQNWLLQHPLTRADLKQEAEYLYNVGFNLLYT